jgi:hypothetical protein
MAKPPGPPAPASLFAPSSDRPADPPPSLTMNAATDEERQREIRRRADAEVDSWIVQPTPAPAAPPPPDQPGGATAAPRALPAPEDGPGPVNAAGQRVPVSFDPQNADEMYRYAQMLARSSLLPKAFYDKDDKEKRHARVADVHFVLMKGKALDLHPMTSIGNINIIDGKAEVGALLMLSIVRRSGLMAPGGWKLVHSDAKRAVFSTLRLGDEEWTTFEYTLEEAELMGLLDKGRDEWAKANNQWRRQPRTMLRRRCQAMLLREVYADVVLGLYDHDELTEMRERERALGIDPDRVIAVSSAVPALPEGAESGPIKRLTEDAKARAAERDPLKARLAARQVERTEATTATAALPSERFCSNCGAPLDERDSDPCIGCR